jgi:RNA polymerase sigma-70 factor (ECF subfamily)
MDPADVRTGTGSDSLTGTWIRDAVERLDADHREVLMLREYEELSYEDIAELLQIPINTVRSRLFRARAELKALLEPHTVKGVTR